MDKIKRPGYDLSLPKSLVLYVTVFTLTALLLSAVTGSVCSRISDAIQASYPMNGERYYLTNEQGEQLGEGAIISQMPASPSARDQRILDLLDVFPVFAAPVYSALCIIAAALLFYRNKLKKPLALLRTASEKISGNDLDFQIEYDSEDELGQLCSSFEIMRKALAGNFKEMWRQVEERKQLNAAFAHELRTPLTVLKGYNEILQASDNPQTRETAATMGKHISRMETYISSMSSLRRLEDARPEYTPVSLQPFLSSLKESAEIVCTKNGKALFVQNKTSAVQMSVDTEFISQVCNNLVANAVRYARTSVTLSFAVSGGSLLLSVSDDGKGFSKSCLKKAADPYFTSETDHSGHFGLGLYICRLLCERHGGCLKIENTADGAKVSAFFNPPV